MTSLTNDERLNLKKLMNEMDYVDNTETIQRLKHSSKIRENIKIVLNYYGGVAYVSEATPL